GVDQRHGPLAVLGHSQLQVRAELVGQHEREDESDVGLVLDEQRSWGGAATALGDVAAHRLRPVPCTHLTPLPRPPAATSLPARAMDVHGPHGPSSGGQPWWRVGGRTTYPR